MEQSIVKADSSSNAGATVLRGAPRGRPFQKGDDERRGRPFTADDPRRNVHGQLNKAAATLNADLRQMLIDEGMSKYDKNDPDSRTRLQAVVRRLYDEAELGGSTGLVATQIIFERVAGKVTQPISAEGDIPLIILSGDASFDDI